MSLGCVPQDALRVVLQYLDAKGLGALRCVSTTLCREAGEESLWDRVCLLELGRTGGRGTFVKVAMLEETAFIGAVVIPYKMVDNFRKEHPGLAGEYDLSGYLIDPIPIRITLTKTGASLDSQIEFFKPKHHHDPTQNDLERAFLAATTPRSELTETEKLHTIRGFGRAYGAGEVEFLGFKGKIVGKKCMAGSTNFGCFYATLENAARSYDSLGPGAVWEGDCYQNGVGEGVYHMKVDVTQVSVKSGVAQGTVSFPNLKTKTRFAGVAGVTPTDPPPTPTASRVRPTDPPPPLCTLFSSPPLRPLHHRFTRFSFTEYQFIEEGPSVVPTSYSAVVLGDVMVGAYRDTKICNHGVFCLSLG